ncbi:hypothetical protein [Hyphomonas sp.]|uniref:hypothetical protein n=1 Tax=Hyphomonas sp. TaxID=87 RepID=UPI0025C67601|nr:hypothetical protein [Hyphomonas sp.]
MRRGRDDFGKFLRENSRFRFGDAADVPARQPGRATLHGRVAEGIPVPSAPLLDHIADGCVSRLRESFALMHGRST